MYRGRKLSRRIALLVALLAALAIAPWGAPAAASTGLTSTTLTISSVGDDFVTQGQNYFLYSPNDNMTVTLNSTGSFISVYANLGTANDWMLEFGATKDWQLNPGTPLHVGTYMHASNRTTAPDEPYLSFGGLGRGEDVIGDFTIQEMTTDADGHLTSLWLTFRMRNVIGEIRYQLPVDGAVEVGPSHMWMPETEPNSPPATGSVTVWNPGSQPVQLGSSSLSGPQVADYSIASDGCAGQTLAPGQTCSVAVTQHPLAVGESDATLAVPEGDGGTIHEVSLTSFVRSTHTEVTLESAPGDYIGQGQNFDFTLANTVFAPQNDSDASRIQIDFGSWVATFGSPAGPALVPGQTYTNGFSVFGNGRGCDGYTGTFTVDEVAFDQWGDLQSLVVRFEQYCDSSATAPLRGKIAYQADGVAVTNPTPRGPARRAGRGHRLLVSGQVAGGRRGQTVGIKLQRKESGRFVTVTKRTLKLGKLHIYKTRLHPAKGGGACRVVARLPQTKAAVSRRAYRRFSC